MAQRQEEKKEDPWQTDPTLKRISTFYSHLDECAQCRNHPFALCREGAKLLKYAATGVMGEEEDR